MKNLALRLALGPPWGQHASQSLDRRFPRAAYEPFSWLTALSCVLSVLCLCFTGCVERRMTIRTNVDTQGGALAIVDGQEVGVTPVSTGFTYYADREIKLIKDGHETLTLIQPIPAPWWDSLLTEFFVENLWPYTIRDERVFQYDLPPQANVSAEELIRRAQQLRNEGQLGAEVVPSGRAAGPSSNVSF